MSFNFIPKSLKIPLAQFSGEVALKKSFLIWLKLESTPPGLSDKISKLGYSIDKPFER